MAEKDLKRFIKKVEQLNSMINSIENDPKRRTQLVSCSNHQQVVALAKSWGFEIGNRWGEDF
tara:strand:- start:176 stop:361 length:186 start_codon:yes stop_codon:yes gene_type:complete